MIHRRPDGSPYDPSGFNVKQYEEQYGPGGVPDGWTAPGSAITPIQDPNIIVAMTVFLIFIAGLLVFAGISALNEGDISTFVWSLIVAWATLGFCIWGFVIASRRRKWLKAKSTERESTNEA